MRRVMRLTSRCCKPKRPPDAIAEARAHPMVSPVTASFYGNLEILDKQVLKNRRNGEVFPPHKAPVDLLGTFGLAYLLGDREALLWARRPRGANIDALRRPYGGVWKLFYVHLSFQQWTFGVRTASTYMFLAKDLLCVKAVFGVKQLRMWAWCEQRQLEWHLMERESVEVNFSSQAIDVIQGCGVQMPVAQLCGDEEAMPVPDLRVSERTLQMTIFSLPESGILIVFCTADEEALPVPDLCCFEISGCEQDFSRAEVSHCLKF
eukprot:Gb_25345 [translate_table: standard]